MIKCEERICLECGGILKGRSDRKFCSDQCRASFNNKLYAARSTYVRSINLILSKNRRILESYYDLGLKEVDKTTLQVNGFDFNFFTQTHTIKGKHWKCCYDFRYTERKLTIEITKLTVLT